MKYLIVALLSIATPALAGASMEFANADWQQIRDEDGIKVYRWTPPGSELFAFKANTVMDASMPRIVSVLVDIARRKEWMPNLLEGKQVRGITTFERIEYMALKTPSVTSNRDFVFDAKAEHHGNQVTLKFTSIDDPGAPEVAGFVRGRVLDSTYTLNAQPGAEKTAVELRVHVDPRGSVPNWIVNFVTRNTPFRTLAAVRKQVTRPDVVVRPEVIELLKQ